MRQKPRGRPAGLVVRPRGLLPRRSPRLLCVPGEAHRLEPLYRLLDQCLALAKKKRISRDALIARGLKALMAAEGLPSRADISGGTNAHGSKSHCSRCYVGGCFTVGGERRGLGTRGQGT